MSREAIHESDADETYIAPTFNFECDAFLINGEEVTPGGGDAHIAGAFGSDGSFSTGIAILSASHPSTGLYNINFTGLDAFAAVAVVACIAGNLNASGSANVVSASTGGCQVRTFNAAGDLADAEFNIYGQAFGSP